VALVFELVINFGDDRSAAQRAFDVVTAARPIAVGGHLIGLHQPLMITMSSGQGLRYIEFSVVPVGVGSNVAVDRGHELVKLDAAGLSTLGVGLYDLLGRIDGYQAAVVGWDPEARVDLDELRLECADELADGSLHGLVLSPQARRTLPHSAGFVPFGRGFEWIAYEGERMGNFN
jgi:hypothetical protein